MLDGDQGAHIESKGSIMYHYTLGVRQSNCDCDNKKCEETKAVDSKQDTENLMEIINDPLIHKSNLQKALAWMRQLIKKINSFFLIIE